MLTKLYPSRPSKPSLPPVWAATEVRFSWLGFTIRLPDMDWNCDETKLFSLQVSVRCFAVAVRKATYTATLPISRCTKEGSTPRSGEPREQFSQFKGIVTCFKYDLHFGQEMSWDAHRLAFHGSVNQSEALTVNMPGHSSPSRHIAEWVTQYTHSSGKRVTSSSDFYGSSFTYDV